MNDLLTFLLLALLLLVTYLCVSVGHRVFRQEMDAAHRRAKAERTPGRTLDMGCVSKRIHQIRQDYVGSPNCRENRSLRHKSRLVKKARRAVTNLGYFRRHELEHESEHDTTS